MIAIIAATTTTIELFGPLFIATLFTLSIVVIGRFVATRKITRALAADGPTERTDGSDNLGVPGWIDSMPTRKFVRKRPQTTSDR